METPIRSKAINKTHANIKQECLLGKKLTIHQNSAKSKPTIHQNSPNLKSIFGKTLKSLIINIDFESWKKLYYLHRNCLLGHTTKQLLTNSEPPKLWKYKQLWELRPECMEEHCIRYKFNCRSKTTVWWYQSKNGSKHTLMNLLNNYTFSLLMA